MKKTIVMFETSTLEFVKMKKTHVKIKEIQVWEQNIYYFGTIKLEFEKAVNIFEINTLEFLNLSKSKDLCKN